MDHEQSDTVRTTQGNGHESRHRTNGAVAEVNGTTGTDYPFLPAQRENGEALRPFPGPFPAGRPVQAHAPPALTVSVVIPTWNEAGNIARVLGQLSRFEDVLIVDAFSDDGTVEVARRVRPDVRVVQRPPRGKGDAMRAGFDLATGDVIVTMDADGSMDAGEVDVFLAMMAVGFDLVKGSRFACGGGSHDLTTTRLLGNAALCKLANIMFHTRWTDLCYGYLALRRSCLSTLALTADGFEIESQILSRAALAGLRIAEIPSVELPRLTGESHLKARSDGTRVLREMLAARLTPRARRQAAALRPVSREDRHA